MVKVWRHNRETESTTLTVQDGTQYKLLKGKKF